MGELTDLQLMLVKLEGMLENTLSFAKTEYHDNKVVITNAAQFLSIFSMKSFIAHGVITKETLVGIAESLYEREGVFSLTQEEAMRVVHSYGDTNLLYEAGIMFGFRPNIENSLKTYGLIGNEDSAIYPCRLLRLDNLTATIEVKGKETKNVFIGRVKTFEEIARHFAVEDHNEYYERQQGVVLAKGPKVIGKVKID